MQSSGMNAIVKLLPSCQQGLFVSQSHKSLHLFVFCLFVDHIKSPIGSNLLVEGSQVFDCLLSCLLLERLWLFIVWLLLITIEFTDQQCKFKTPVTMVIASKVADPGVFRDVAEPGSSVVSLGVVEMGPGLHSGNSDKRTSSKMRNISCSEYVLVWGHRHSLYTPGQSQIGVCAVHMLSKSRVRVFIVV